jgi:hypothetical protein
MNTRRCNCTIAAHGVECEQPEVSLPLQAALTTSSLTGGSTVADSQSSSSVAHSPETHRTCKKCGQVKPIDSFPPYRAKGVIGHRHTCRECWNAKWTPVVVEHNKRYYHENINGYRDRAKNRTARQHRKDGALHNLRNKQFAERHPQKAAAKKAVAIAVRKGSLVPQPCRVCGKKAQAHHDDYSKPLDVIWLCPVHHGERHRLLNRYGDPAEWPEDLRVREFPGA